MVSRKYIIVLQTLWILFLVYFFLVSIQLMGAGFKLFGKGFAERLIVGTTNPFVGLFIGILATSIIQSSSASTAITIALVAAGSVTFINAIPIVMGANIGTTVTSSIVALGHIHRKEELKYAYAAATSHDFFNILTVGILFPLQVKFNILSNISNFLVDKFVNVGGMKFIDPLKIITKLPIKFFKYICFNHPIPIIILGLIILFTSLILIEKTLQGFSASRMSNYLNVVIFNSWYRAFLAGFIVTGFITQSSSVTVSLIVPLVGSRILSVESIFPYIMGCNIGTTTDCILAGLCTGNPHAIALGICHLIFNCIGTAIFLPLRRIPIALAKLVGIAVSKRRFLAIVFVIVVYFLIPIILIWLSR